MFARICLNLCAFGAVTALGSTGALAEDFLVRNQTQYFAAAKQVEAGDTIILANGEWRDFEITLTGKGTPSNPIVLRAEEAGAVTITGQSNLRLGGEHMIVSGLVFRDGYSPTGEVLSFRRSKEDQASHSRMTEMVVDGFSKPDRYESDYWVGMYGSNNRFDHNYLGGKTNKGVTMAVRLDSEESRENNHRIDHNYFGERPTLGSNGGETLRVGTSKYAQYNSNTVIENNYFERCDGEVEIISIKAGGNIVRGNVFDASQGALTLRHGDDNLVERNVFFGRGKAHTGGIRVINANQTVRHNYMEGLRGDGFASALAVMNGVPNSPANRYVQVSGADISGNSIIDSSRIGLGIGADEERSAAPVDSVFSDNLLSASGDGTFIGVDADISGITFSGNRLMAGNVDNALSGLTAEPLELERAANGLLYPADPAITIGAPRDLDPVKREATGPAWYAKPDAAAIFGSGTIIAVEPGEGTIDAALKNAKAGDTLMLSAGEYIVNKTALLDFPLTVSGSIGDEGEEPEQAVISFARPSLFEMAEGGGLRLENVSITGRDSPDNVGNNVVRTTSVPIRGNFVIEFDGVSVSDLDVNRSFDVIVIGKNTFADAITITNSAFANITGTVVKADAETDDYGQYGVEYLTISDSAFSGVRGGVADIYRGGRDESTFGPHVLITDSAFADAGSTDGSPAVLLHGVQDARIADNSFATSGPVKIVHTVGTPKTVISGNAFDDESGVVAEELNFPGEPRVIMNDNVMAGVE